MAKVRSVLLVAVQFGSLALLLLSGPLLPAGAALRALLLAGVLLGLWAVATMDRRSFTVLPDVRPGGSLATSGPYRYIRHPMYAAVLLAALALVLDHPSVARLLAWAVLLADLLVKLHYEERLLAERFPEYRDYCARTARLIPFLF
ncbi:methyltransferase family protein [Nitrospira sp. Kam-Ns4a]